VTFTDPIQVIVAQTADLAGFSDPGKPLDILDDVNNAFATYALTTSIGPIVGSSVVNINSSFGTTGGAFILTSAGDATFTATIPEPSTWAMMLIGFAGLAYAGYRRATRAAHAASLAANG